MIEKLKKKSRITAGKIVIQSAFVYTNRMKWRAQKIGISAFQE